MNWVIVAGVILVGIVLLLMGAGIIAGLVGLFGFALGPLV